MLKLNNVHAYYGKSHVLHGVNFDVGVGEIVALLGRNGSGRSTTVKTIMGLVDGSGSVRWREQELLGRQAFEIAHAGIGYVPENRDIFPELTVQQNLMLGQKSVGRAGRWASMRLRRWRRPMGSSTNCVSAMSAISMPGSSPAAR